jgi:hypothetical protein
LFSRHFSLAQLPRPFSHPQTLNTAIMPLEATMIVVDNSEASRNGDYL